MVKTYSPPFSSVEVGGEAAASAAEAVVVVEEGVSAVEVVDDAAMKVWEP